MRHAAAIIAGVAGEKNAMVKPWRGEAVTASPDLITPGLDPGVFFAGQKGAAAGNAQEAHP
jgi:hypothetical protein